MAYRFTNGHSDCQDLSQDIFLSVYKNLPAFRGQSSFSTWIYRLSVNRCLDWCRKRKRAQAYIHKHAVPCDDESSILDRIPSDSRTPEEELVQKEEEQSLHRAIALLPDKYKTVIIMYHFQNLSYKEIGEILSLPTRTVETQLYRAKQQLRKILTREEGGKASWNVKEFGII